MAGIYIHIPFCERKCIYCDFYSLADLKDFDIFISFLLREIRIYSKLYNIENISTIYFGGGTPSLFNPDQIGKILNGITKLFVIGPDPEVTIEVNPGTTTIEKLKGYLDIGINRLSIGVQSFFDEDLQFLTRIHNSIDAKNSIQNAIDTGFKNISVDLMYALPTQTITSIKENLEIAISYPIQHISAYSLILEDDTPLAKMVGESRVKLIPEEAEAEMMEFVMNFLNENGFLQYEVSNFAVPGYESKHNQNYWNHTNYIGCGPSAHSFWNGKRWWNVSSIFAYYSRLNNDILPVTNSESLTQEQILNEMLFLGLRSAGINLNKISGFLKKDFKKAYIKEIDYLIENKFAIIEADVLKLTPKGYIITDEIFSMLTKNN